MTDNEIIKALECCSSYDSSCDKCVLEKDCLSPIVTMERLMKDALDLINRQKAEIEELEAEIDKQYEQAEADILGNMADGGTSCHWCIDKHRANAIKEFAERLKEYAYYNSDQPWADEVVDATKIDNLVKEMVGDGG